MDHEIIISGGTVVDGSGSEPVKADVAIDNGRISRVGNDARDRMTHVVVEDEQWQHLLA